MMILAGLGLAFVYPLYQLDYTGSEVARGTVFDRADGGWQNGWHPIEVQLGEADNPVRIHLEGEILAGQFLQTGSLPVDISVTGPNGVLLSGKFQMTIVEGNDPASRKPRRVRLVLPEFGVFENGIHRLEVTTGLTRDISLDHVEASFLAGAEVPDNRYREPGLWLAGIGLLLYLLGGRRRRRENEEPVRKSSRWGRQ
jgi:hypothetical protein